MDDSSIIFGASKTRSHLIEGWAEYRRRLETFLWCSPAKSQRSTTKIFLVTLLIVSVLATWWRLSLIGRRILLEPKPLEGRSITPLATLPGWVTTPLSRRLIWETLRRVCRSPITGRRITPLATHVGWWKLRSYVFQKKFQWGRTKIILFVLLFVSLLADSDTSRPLQTSCQNAYSSCGMGNDSPVSSLSDDVAIRQIAASIGQGQQSRTLV